MHNRKMLNEYRLVLLCTRLEINKSNQQEIKELLSNSLDWNKIIEISNYQGILPFLYHNLNKLNFQYIIPQDIFLILKNCYYANLKKNFMLEKEISLILELANRQGISIIPFKGFALIQTLYHDPGLRIMADVDILIKKDEYNKIKEILTRLGYKENRKVLETQDQEYQFEVVFSKIFSLNLPLIIELHYSLAPARPYAINLPYLWERTQERTINNQKLLCLSQEDTFLSLALHLRRHTRRLTLKFIVDIAELLNINKNKLDWAYIMKSAKNNHIISTVYFALYITHEMFGVSVSGEMLNEFQPNIIKTNFVRLSINKYNFFSLKKWQGVFLRFLLFDSIIDFILYLWRVSFLERFVHK